LIDFRSDNVAPAAEEVMRGLVDLGRQTASPYGDDDETQHLSALLTEVFGRAAVGWPMPTGTSANAMTIGALLPEGGAVVCHERAHALCSEEGATTYANPRIRFVALQGKDGRLDPASCEVALRSVSGPKLLTLTQANEYGCAYDLPTLAALSEVARRAGARLHLDGARLAAACCALGISPRDVVAAAQPDALALGLTKVGAVSTDAAIFFGASLPQDWRATMRRSGLLSSKMRYQSIQIHILMRADLWLELARHSVQMAQRLSQGLESAPGIICVRPSQSNVLLVEFTNTVRNAFAASPFLVKQWIDPKLTRLVTSHATQMSEVDQFIAWLQTV
jgi:threonine aldolase